ncbi:MAG: hypothetical protein ABI591_07480 [Kofleriaceae bacterium]
MSRKNLSRTVIEGGRYFNNQVQRRDSNRSERATTRAWLDRVEVDVGDAEYTAPPPRRVVRKMFYDKLAPAKRWLASQVGRPWDTVYHELRTTFDRKTIAGNHVLEHMLDWVQVGPTLEHRYHRERDFIVDLHGTLRHGRFYGRSWSRLRKEALSWAQSRRIVKLKSRWWWVRVRGVGIVCSRHPCSATHYELYDGKDYVGRFHQFDRVVVRELSPGDLQRFARLPSELRSLIVVVS